MPLPKVGLVTERTQKTLEKGLRGKPMSPMAVQAVTQQAEAFLVKVIDHYESCVATGEVGPDGTGVAVDVAPTGEPATGLLYGRVQSGKTAAMVLSAALSIDNGFRLVIVTTANNVALVRQTTTRLKALGGPAVLSTLKEAGSYSWTGQEGAISQDLRSDGLVVVCAKDTTHMSAVYKLLQAIDAAGVPALILDDEADAATPDTTLAARTSGAAKAPKFASTTHRKLISNTAPGEEGESIREALPHHVYVQVTATPQVLFLQRQESLIRPSFVHLLEPGGDYCGGQVFFQSLEGDPDSAIPPLVFLPDNETAQLAAARKNAPQGLADSVAFFLLAAALQVKTSPSIANEGYKHLSHTSSRIDQHDRVARFVTERVRMIRRQFKQGDDDALAETFEGAYAELAKTNQSLPPLDELLEIVDVGLDQVEIIQVNAATDEPKYGPTFNFLVGGNILGRGLTIDDLLVTYYVREAKTPQMDTVWQHARMYGYRAASLASTRLYLPARLARLFLQIHQSEEELRSLLKKMESSSDVPIRLMRPGRATRANALDANVLQVYQGDTQIVPYFAVLPSDAPEMVAALTATIEATGAVLPEATPREQRFVKVGIDTIIAIVREIPLYDDDGGRWDTDAIIALLEATRADFGEEAHLYVRAFDPGTDPYKRRFRGVLSGPEVAMAEATGTFVLALTYATLPGGIRYWYPTLIPPKTLPAHIFNPE